MPANSVTQLEILLGHSGWARALARRLVEDAGDAEDLVQEAYAVALEHSPSRGVPVRAWLARVLRNLARARWRARVRRELREWTAARREAIDPGHEVLERFELQRQLAEELAALEEPFQSALLMRYFDGLAPEEIARRTGENVRTVHSRLHRGLARLRERLLRRSGGDARSWMLALFPLGSGRGDIAGSLLGGWIVNTQLKVAAAVVAVGLLAVTVEYWPVGAPSVPQEQATEVEERALVEQPLPGEDGERATSERTEIATSTEPDVSALEEPTELAHEVAVSGRVVDGSGIPLAGIEIGVRVRHGIQAEPESEPRAVSRADGSFVLRGPEFSGKVTIVSPDWVALFEASVDARATAAEATEVLLVAARALSIAGTVFDESANPIPGAELEYVIPPDLRTRFPGLLDAAPQLQCVARSDLPGDFRMLRVPDAAGGTIRVHRAGFEEQLVAVPDHSRDGMVIVLHSRQDVAFLPGKVVDSAGSPVEDAVVVLGKANARSDTGGAFLLALERAGDSRVIQAVKRGHLPARIECAAGESNDPRAWPEPLVLELGARPLSIGGVVVDADGRPVGRAQVSIVDRTYLGIIEARFGSERIEAPQWIENELCGGLGFGDFVFADEQGHFRLEGLLDRSYTVQAFDPRSLAHALLPAIEAGREDVEIRLACEQTLPTIRGRVVGRSGAPIEGALVLPVRTILRNYRETEPSFGENEVSGQGPYTDEEGRFEIRSLCSDALGLRVTHSTELASVSVRFDEVASLDAVEIVLSLQCHLQVDLEGSSIRANHLRVLDAGGEEMTLVAYHGDVSFASAGFAFAGEKSEAFVVHEDAATLVLLQDQLEVARIPLFLRAGELNVIRP